MINKIVANNLKEIRKNRKLSLDGLAELTGVSKSMLGQIEREESNPTLQTLWKIASGLKISLSDLIVAVVPQVEVIKRKDIQPISEDQGRFKIYPIAPFDGEKGFEVLSLVLLPGAKSISEPHSRGTEELILVNQGELTLEIADQSYTIAAGDAFRFIADKDHCYKNTSIEEVTFTNIIYYPNNLEV